MRHIPKRDLSLMSSRALRALLEFDSWGSDPREKLSKVTVEHVHDIAADRYERRGDDKEALNLLKCVARVLAPAY